MICVIPVTISASPSLHRGLCQLGRFPHHIKSKPANRSQRMFYFSLLVPRAASCFFTLTAFRLRSYACSFKLTNVVNWLYHLPFIEPQNSFVLFSFFFPPPVFLSFSNFKQNTKLTQWIPICMAYISLRMKRGRVGADRKWEGFFHSNFFSFFSSSSCLFVCLFVCLFLVCLFVFDFVSFITFVCS